MHLGQHLHAHPGLCLRCICGVKQILNPHLGLGMRYYSATPCFCGQQIFSKRDQTIPPIGALGMDAAVVQQYPQNATGYIRSYQAAFAKIVRGRSGSRPSWIITRSMRRVASS